MAGWNCSFHLASPLELGTNLPEVLSCTITEKDNKGLTGWSTKCESGSCHFQPGEGPSRGLLRDYEPSDGPF